MNSLSSWTFALILVAGSVFATEAHSSGIPGPIGVSAERLAVEVSDPQVVVLDIRPLAQYTEGHLPGAIHVPSEATDPAVGPEAWRERLGDLGLSGPETVVLVGSRGLEEDVTWAFLVLELAGVAQVRILSGGFLEWKSSGGEIGEAVSHLPEQELTPQGPPNMALSADTVQQLIGADGTVLLDLRTGPDWKLFEPSPAFGAGHIPGALGYDFSTLLGGAAGWPDLSQAKSEFAKLGPRSGSPVGLHNTFVLYGDHRADRRLGMGYTLLRLLGLPVHIFQPGWEGWTEDGSRPFVRLVTAAQVRALQEASPGRSDDGYYNRLPIFDLRELRDWEASHLPGSYPLSAIEFPRFFELVVREYWPNASPVRDPVVLYCYGPDCIRSRRGALVAAQEGWQEILWFRDGVSGWFEAGYPFVSSR